MEDDESQQNETTYKPVRHKKQEGSMHLNSTSITFRASGNTVISIPWSDVDKHQVSPASHPKSLLKLILLSNGGGGGPSSPPSLTFQFMSRDDLEAIRKDITHRLQLTRGGGGGGNSRKRVFSEVQQSSSPNKRHSVFSTTPASFGELDPTALAVTRSSLLAANPALRQQHHYLVEETETVSEEDFWKTHEALLEEEYARISGLAKAGTSSLIQSYLPASGRVTLGVEEMRQIFILYPAVYKAYEEKVPLELSDDQFWKKYLASEYFHRDRGRMGTAARNHAPMESNKPAANSVDKENAKLKQTGPTQEQQDARAAAVSTDDLFSRYDQKLAEQSAGEDNFGGMTSSASAAVVTKGRGADSRGGRKWGRRLAVGQFDLASTFETERGELLEGPRDNHPPNVEDDGKGARVIQKYNRHWAMVLHPDEAVAGSNLLQVARRSVNEVLPDSNDAEPGGGTHVEMKRLVDFASAEAGHVNHAAGRGYRDDDDEEGITYGRLTLKNVEAYYAGQSKRKEGDTKETEKELAKRHSAFANFMASKTRAMVMALQKEAVASNGQALYMLPTKCFPSAQLGLALLSQLTKKMAQDSQTEAASLEMVNNLPEDFRKKLQSYFRRSSELLRHFFGHRRLLEAGSDGTQDGGRQKLSKIVHAMETFYREMEVMRKDLPQTETGEMMRKLCLPIMDQLDWAFKLLHRSNNGGGGGGGFVAVEEN